MLESRIQTQWLLQTFTEVSTLPSSTLATYSHTESRPDLFTKEEPLELQVTET